MKFRLVEELEDSMDVAGKRWIYDDSYHFFKNGKMWHHSQAGDQLDADMRVYRKSPKWNLYVTSFRGAAYPYSTCYLANKATGKVYTDTLYHNGGSQEYIKDVVDWMNDMYEPPKLDSKPVGGWTPLI